MAKMVGEKTVQKCCAGNYVPRASTSGLTTPRTQTALSCIFGALHTIDTLATDTNSNAPNILPGVFTFGHMALLKADDVALGNTQICEAIGVKFAIDV